jgi:transcriptional regulator with XRE-family HTH domain
MGSNQVKKPAATYELGPELDTALRQMLELAVFRKVSRKELAEAAGVTPANITLIMQGKISPTLKTAQSLMSAAGKLAKLNIKITAEEF